MATIAHPGGECKHQRLMYLSQLIVIVKNSSFYCIAFFATNYISEVIELSEVTVIIVVSNDNF